LAEYGNGRNSTRAHSFQSTCSGFGKFNRVIVMAKKGLQCSGGNFYFFREKSHFL
jgi:hypothetical protein